MSFMGKKEVVITSRVSSEMMDILKSIADEDDRTIAWVVRKLLVEAMEARGHINRDDKRA